MTPLFSARLLPAAPARGLTLRAAAAAAAVALLASACTTSRAPDATPADTATRNVIAQPLAARANGIAVRPGDGARIVTDDRNNALLVAADQASPRTLASVPAVAGQANSLSQPVFAAPGVLLVSRFGFGTAGTVFVVDQGQAAPLAGLAPQRRRLGLASLGAGRALSSWFVKDGAAPITGGVSLVTYDTATHAASERDLVVGLAKPVGVAVSGDTVFVSDQSRGAILRYSLNALLAASAPANGGPVFASVDGPDLLAADAHGALYTKCRAHGVCRIAPDGTLTQLAGDFEDARGVAIDETRHRLYVVDRARSSNAPSLIRTIDLDGAHP
ncbi:NHL repeat-containing protein [Paraburkholderia acidisoli]|uniref:Sugar lactone lactonase YvrE n=1 Tax=Paraburkholderia acidisoli TaxID=2571748 RepID=A0A7Z2JI51_9BURK|nr:hypothetical protein [Paraburkholderia acidisoli]QGZ65331.1 hypothetical protein FAZ98_26555 [Paraburkholderia acidisoli]